jgi:hypothetical protein
MRFKKKISENGLTNLKIFLFTNDLVKLNAKLNATTIAINNELSLS